MYQVEYAKEVPKSRSEPVIPFADHSKKTAILIYGARFLSIVSSVVTNFENANTRNVRPRSLFEQLLLIHLSL